MDVICTQLYKLNSLVKLFSGNNLLASFRKDRITFLGLQRDIGAFIFFSICQCISPLADEQEYMQSEAMQSEAIVF
eukprot:scaffold527158_cov22-Prasinocladus_malaysianus.AAC.1